jgi:hypothetical protein
MDNRIPAPGRQNCIHLFFSYTKKFIMLMEILVFRSRLYAFPALLLCVAFTTACDSGDSSAAAPAAESSKAAATTAPVERALSDAARFDKDIRKQACDILTTERVSELFAVPAGELRQMKIMGCMYTWDKDGEMLEAKLTMLRAHKSEKSAAQWFKKATRNLTAEEAQAQVDMVFDKVKKKAEEDGLNAGVSGEQVDTVAKGSSALVGEDGFQYEDLPGIGSEARISLEDGSIWLRVDNLTFMVGAYKGPEQAELEFNTTDLKEYARIAQEAQRAFVKETFNQRKEDALKVAELVIDELP